MNTYELHKFDKNSHIYLLMERKTLFLVPHGSINGFTQYNIFHNIKDFLDIPSVCGRGYVGIDLFFRILILSNELVSDELDGNIVITSS